MNSINLYRDQVNSNVSLQEKILAGGDILELAKEAGFSLTRGELESYLQDPNNTELSDFELEAAAGGCCKFA